MLWHKNKQQINNIQICIHSIERIEIIEFLGCRDCHKLDMNFFFYIISKQTNTSNSLQAVTRPESNQIKAILEWRKYYI